jgi:hypothetical protein
MKDEKGKVTRPEAHDGRGFPAHHALRPTGRATHRVPLQKNGPRTHTAHFQFTLFRNVVSRN